MKKIISIIVILVLMLVSRVSLKAQMLNVPEIIQEQTQWCWSATSLCVLDYFNYPNTQCTIAEYARSVITWYNFGTANCCTDPSQGCNYWNYMWGDSGSLENILNHFGNINCLEYYTSLTIPEIQYEISGGHPFVFRWGWYSGGGHFLVGFGIQDSSLYYMNPLPGYGYEIADFDWVVDDGNNHSWTHTLKIANACPPPSPPGPITGSAVVCNNSTELYSTTAVSGVTDYSWTFPGGWTGVSTTTSVAATVGPYSGLVSVSAENSCGSSIIQSLDVNVTAIDKSVTANGQTLISNATSGTYQWVTCPNMQIIPGAVSQTFTPSQSGTYAAIINQNNCVDTSYCHLISIIGIEKINNSFNAKIYPNPTSNFLNIKFIDPVVENYRMVLTDVFGQVINSKAVEITGSVFEMQIDVSGLSSGIYFLNINNADGNMVFRIQKINDF